jgi:hypothetical protein
MVLKGKAKEVWWRFRQIKNSKDIPVQLDAVYAIDSSEDDEYIFHIVEYVKLIDEVFLKGTANTDRTALYLAGLKSLKELTLARNPAITRDALSSISRITTLEYLDLTGTAVEPADLSTLSTLVNLREIHLTSATDDPGLIRRELASFQERHPDCVCWVNYQSY